MRNGIDISKYQGSINWSKVANSGKVEFAWPRIGYRGYKYGNIVKDPRFEEYMDGAAANGILTDMVYFFSQAVSEEEAREEARWCVKMLEKYPATVAIAIDSEWANNDHTGRADRLSKEQRTAVTLAFLREVELNAYEGVVYASLSWFGAHLDMSGPLGWYKIWNAAYGRKTPGRECMAWQHSSNGDISGVSGRCDLDVQYTDFKVKVSSENNETAALGSGLLKKGCKGDAVATLQRLLVQMGYSVGKTGVDGIYGSKTASAVTAFQKDKGLTPDGIVGANTRAMLYACSPIFKRI